MRRSIWLILITGMFWGSVQAIDSRPTACFSVLEYTDLTIIHDKESGDEKDEAEEEEEPDCE